MMITEELKPRERVDGFVFRLSEDQDFYECRGEIVYDEDHDQIPEPKLWAAAEKLAKKLQKIGYEQAEPEHSEKGWVEVML